MSSKIGLVLSLAIFALFFVLSIDVICIQYHYSDLDSTSVAVGYEISHLEEIKNEDIARLEEKYHLLIVDISNKKPTFGDVVEYTLLREYKPLIVSNDTMELKVKRNTVIGYY